MGKIIREDSINGKLCRVLHVVEVDKKEVDRTGRNVDVMTSSILQSSGFMSSFAAQIADANAGIREEEQPIPLRNTFYFVYNNQLFEATDNNIMKYIKQSRRREYRNFTRTAEIISENASSILKIWEKFFVNY
jgi:hypothetical protein